MKTKMIALVFVFMCINVSAQSDGSVSESLVNGTKLTVCSLDKVKKTKTIPLSELVEDCAVVQLEYSEEALFNPWFTTVTEKYIGVRQQGNGAYKLFSRSGKFLCDVGARGNGPGEYAMILYDDLIDDKNELIYLVPMAGNKVLVYNTSGKFVKEITAPQKLNKPKLHLDKDILSVVHMAFNGDKAIALQFDVKNGQVVKNLAPPAHFLVGDFNGEIFNTHNTPAFDFCHTNSDTLYHYNINKNAMEPVFTMTYSSSEKPYKQYMELKNRYITNVFGKGLVMTDPQAKTSSYITVVNDFFGNMKAPFYVVHIRNGYYVYNLESAQLMEEIEKRLGESGCSNQDKEKLKKLLSTLDEDNNNVVFIGKLK